MRWIGIALILPALLTPVRAQSPAPTGIVVRQSLDPPSGAVIGQHVALNVDVLFTGEMPHPPRVTVPDVPGLQVFRFETQATTLRETTNDVTYVGQRFAFALYARRGGTFDIPPAQVSLLDPRGEITGTAEGQAVRLEIAVPNGVDPSGPVVATRGLTLAEQWEPDPKTAFNAGGAIVRTITRTAEDVPGLAMRDLAFPAPDGVRVYADPPEITDHSTRGELTGRRTDRVTYVFERGGRVVLPAVTQPWWDLADKALKTAHGDGVSLDVAAVSVTDPKVAKPGVPHGLLALIAGATLLLFGLVWFGIDRLRRRQMTIEQGENAAFAALGTACAGGDAATIYRALGAWRRWLAPDRDIAIAQIARPLDGALFAGTDASWNETASHELFRSIGKIRNAPPPTHAAYALPPLN